MPTIKVPAVLAGTGGAATVDVDGDTVGELFENHAAEHGPGLRNSVVEDDDIKEFINVYVDGEPVDGLDAAVPADGQVRVIPAASGGA